MRYLSIDIEATGLAENCLMIEFAMVPFDAKTGTLEENLARTTFIQCPSFEELKPTLDPWVVEHNETLIRRAHAEGLPMPAFRQMMQEYLESAEVKTYFNNQKITLFGKSMSAIDLPFLNRDLGWDFMRKYFQHRQLDLSGLAYGLMDLGLLPPGMESGSGLMRYLGMGNVAHTALEDARNTALMYLKIIEKIKT
jgi:DNA polymerase-3 subunit epsilon